MYVNMYIINTLWLLLWFKLDHPIMDMYNVHVHIMYIITYFSMCSSTLRVVDQTGKIVPCFIADVVLSLPNIVSTRCSLMDYTCTITSPYNAGYPAISGRYSKCC